MNAVAMFTGVAPRNSAFEPSPAALEASACCGIGMAHSPPMHAQQHLFRAGDALRDFYIVRSGSYKCYWADRRGQEYVTGFRFPGEPLGLNAVFAGRHPNSAVALETSTVWLVPYAELRRMSAVNEKLRTRLFSLVAQEMANAAMLSCDYTAEERVAKFLLDLAQRFARRGCSATSFQLSMSRGDIASHLRLATETVTRVLTQFQARGLITVARREVCLTNSAHLQQLCASMDGVAPDSRREGAEQGFDPLPAAGAARLRASALGS